LRDNFDQPWTRQAYLEERLIRGKFISVTGHEESHPWLPASPQWLEEFKASLLGFYSAYQSGAFSQEDIESTLLSILAATLDVAVIHWQKRKAGEHELEAYYVGDTVFNEFMRQTGVLIQDDSGCIVDVALDQFAPALSQLVNETLDVIRGIRPTESLMKKYFDERVWDRFRALVRT